MLLWALLACTPPEQKESTPVGEEHPWPPAPSVYDCSAGSPPERWIPRDPTCATDRSCPDILVSAHRGAGGQLGVIAPEDTVQAVWAAIAYGVDFVETDPRPTADGHLVNLHDTSVDRTTDGSGEAEALTLAEIQSFSVDSSPYPGDYSCTVVPTLEQILEAARGRVHVLVDANKTDRVDLLVEAIVSTDTLDWAIFDTSSVEKIDQALAIEPGLHTMIRVPTVEELDSQLAHFADHPPVIVEVDNSSVELNSATLAAGHRPLTDVFIEDAQAAGSGNVEVYGQVLDDGVRIPQTDRPDLLLPYVWER
ncbi:MAG TPA: glycerophosphodiester phosphodiesterase family protein [Myxococcota bacterium]|nr:glycerophosphodiester phosphodiesterase family protein [Myxococcota bacterium]